MYRIILWFIFFVIYTISNLSAQPDESAIIERKADEYLSRLVSFGLNGTVLIAKDEKIVLNKGYGYTDLNKHFPNTSNTIFSLGSIVKPFTATLIMELVQDKKLVLDAPLDDYFSNVPNDKKGIQVHHLLSHSSGLPEAIGNDSDYISKEDFLSQVWETKLEFSPRENYLYSNVGFTLLAMIIEKVTGMEYEEYLKQTILVPAGMFSTGYTNANWNKENIAHNYVDGKDNGTFLERTYYPTWHLIGNGGMLSTTLDMYKFYLFIKGDQLLNEDSKKKMWTPVFMDDAYGWVNIDNGEIIQHNGGSTDGNGAVMKWYPKDNLFMMIFTNSTINGKQGFAMIEQPLENIIFGDDVPLPPDIIPYVGGDIPDLSGSYHSDDSINFTISHFGKTFSLFPNNQKTLNLFLNDNDDVSFLQSSWNLKVEEAINDAVQFTDFESLKYICDEPEKLKNSIINELEMEGYKHAKARAIYSLKMNNEMTKTLVAVSDHDFKGECMLFHMLFKYGKFAGLGVNFGFPILPKIMLVPNAKNSFTGYDFNTNKGVTWEYETNENGKIAAISVGNSVVKVNNEN